MEIVRPRWSTRSFLLYAGGLTCLLAFVAWVGYLSVTAGPGGRVGWTLVLALGLAAAAFGLRLRGEAIAAGVFAFVAVAALVVFGGVLFDWFGWQTAVASFRGFHPATLLVELLWLAAAVAALRAFRFPFLAVHVLLAAWILVVDLISNGGAWSATVTLLVGLVYLGGAFAVDDAYAMWTHVAAGVLIGGSLLRFLHHGNVEWALVALAAVGYIVFAEAIGRSSWAVLGFVGLVLAAVHYSLSWLHVQFLFFSGGHGARGWVPPLVLSVLGLLVVALGLRGRARAQVREQLA
jgi:hypothetical protein